MRSTGNLFSLPNLDRLRVAIDGDESPPSPLALNLPNAMSPSIRVVDLSLSGRWIKLGRSLVLPHRLCSLTLDLRGGVGIDAAGWSLLAESIRETHAGLRVLSLQLAIRLFSRFRKGPFGFQKVTVKIAGSGCVTSTRASYAV